MLNTIKQDSSTKADVYSFGVIMFEVFFETVPYSEEAANNSIIGLSTSVINGKRPVIPQRADDVSLNEKRYLDLMQECWSGNPDERPSFDHVFSVFMDILSE
jgi:hypothetical protein